MEGTCLLAGTISPPKLKDLWPILPPIVPVASEALRKIGGLVEQARLKAELLKTAAKVVKMLIDEGRAEVHEAPTLAPASTEMSILSRKEQNHEENSGLNHGLIVIIGGNFIYTQGALKTT